MSEVDTTSSSDKSLPDLSFWERLVANNYTTMSRGMLCMLRVVSSFYASEEAPFLPLDFWGAEEKASLRSIFFDHENDSLLKAPILCNADGSATKFSEILVEVKLDLLFGDEDSITVDQLFEYDIYTKQLDLAFHILATMLEEILRINWRDWFGDDEVNHIVKRSCEAGGGDLVMNGSSSSSGQKVTLSEFRKNYTMLLRSLVLQAEVNRDLFVVYCIVRMNDNNNPTKLTIPQLLKEYRSLEALYIDNI